MTTRSEHAARDAMRFPQIEGLRGYLSWAVVVWHSIQTFRLHERFHALAWTAETFAVLPVDVFMIISGFVITHLLVTRREAWAPYMIRRAFRLVPPYRVALVAGICAYSFVYETGPVVWNDGTRVVRLFGSAELAPMFSAFWANVLLHITLLQGVVPDSLMPGVSFAYLGPAWTLSLEWQFYIVAPAAIWLLRSPKWSAFGCTLFVAAFLVFQWKLAGHYELRSFLPAAAPLFLFGIATRLAYTRLTAMITRPAAAAIAFTGAAILVWKAADYQWLAPALWMVFVCAMTARQGSEHGTDRLLAGIADLAFSSGAAQWAGRRAYSVYLMQGPLAVILAYCLIPRFSGVAAIAVFAVAKVAAILVASELMHRLVEGPANRLGKRIASRWGPQESKAPTPGI